MLAVHQGIERSDRMEDQAIRQDRSQRAGARQDPRLDWWRAARFGMFIHWGLYAVPAGEWKGRPIPGIGEWIMYRARIPVAEYERLTEQFNPVRFDAAEWVSLARKAGQKYMIITSKHHDGFCMFKSDVTQYNIVDATPFGRDPMQELAAECQRQGLKFGFYYSQTQDWHHPDGDGNDWDYDESKKDFAGYIEGYVKPQVRELLTHYGPIAVIWFDTPKGITAAQSQSLLELVHEVQPACLVCGRLGNALGDYASAGDNKIPQQAVDADWETPATINDTWGFKADDHNWKSVPELILFAERRPDGRGPDPPAERGAPAGDGRVAGGQRRRGVRHAARPAAGPGVVPQHLRSGQDLPARL
jgi:alpha-L-fucosidase